MKILKMFFYHPWVLKPLSGLYFMLLCVLFSTSAFNKPDYTCLYFYFSYCGLMNNFELSCQHFWRVHPKSLLGKTRLTGTRHTEPLLPSELNLCYSIDSTRRNIPQTLVHIDMMASVAIMSDINQFVGFTWCEYPDPSHPTGDILDRSADHVHIVNGVWHSRNQLQIICTINKAFAPRKLHVTFCTILCKP